MSRNIVSDYINYDKKYITNYLNVITNNEMDSKYLEHIVETFINVRYYDLYEHQTDSVIDNISYYVKKEAEKFLLEENDNMGKIKLKRNVDNALWLIKYILLFEKITSDKKLNKLLNELDEKVQKKFANASIVKEDLFDTIKTNTKNKMSFLRKTNSTQFSVTPLSTNISYVYDSVLNNSIKIPDLFSQVAINRVYNDGIIGEDKLLVQYTMTSILVLQDIIKFNYKTNYLIDFNINLLGKKNKLSALLKIIDNELLKEKIHIKVNYLDYLENKEAINNLIHDGYKFCAILPEGFHGNTQLLSLFTYIILDDKLENHNDLKELNNLIIKELIGVEV